MRANTVCFGNGWTCFCIQPQNWDPNLAKMLCGLLSGLKYPIASLRIEHRWHLASEVAGDGKDNWWALICQSPPLGPRSTQNCSCNGVGYIPAARLRLSKAWNGSYIYPKSREQGHQPVFFCVCQKGGMGGPSADGRLLLAYKADPILRNREGRLPSDLILCHDACVVKGCEAGDLMVTVRELIKSYRWYGSTIPLGWNVMPVLSCWILLEFWEFIYVPTPCVGALEDVKCSGIWETCLVDGLLAARPRLHCKLHFFFGIVASLTGGF